MDTIDTDMIGAPASEAPTPALLLDLDALEANIAHMARFFAERPCGVRPHFKSHKCATIAKMQMEAGAVGITCAKLGEAEVLADAGIHDILIANQVVGSRKMPRLARLAGRCDLRVAVDSAANVEELSFAATEAGVTLGVLVEVDVGMGRCGVAPGQPALHMARAVSAAAGLRFDGLMGYEGHAVLLRDADRRRATTLEALGVLVKTRRLIEDSVPPVRIVSSGGTGTYDITGDYPGIDEVQAGSYATMDWYYRDIRPEFEQAISVLATIISRPRAGVVVLDVGVKGIGGEFGPPRVKGHPEADVSGFGSEEHCLVGIPDSTGGVGDTLELIPSHGCTTCNLHRRFVVHQRGRIADIWPIEGSGRLT